MGIEWHTHYVSKDFFCPFICPCEIVYMYFLSDANFTTLSFKVYVLNAASCQPHLSMLADKKGIGQNTLDFNDSVARLKAFQSFFHLCVTHSLINGVPALFSGFTLPLFPSTGKKFYLMWPPFRLNTSWSLLRKLPPPSNLVHYTRLFPALPRVLL